MAMGAKKEKDEGMLTMEARVEDRASLQVLLSILEVMGGLRHRLFRDVYVKNLDANDLKREYTQWMTARTYNALRSEVDGVAGSVTELLERNITEKIGKIASAKSWLKTKKKRLKTVDGQIKALSTYKKKKKMARGLGKRLKMPSRLRGLSLAQLTSERTKLKMVIHNKKRYLSRQEGGLKKLQARRKAAPSVCFGTKALFKKQHHLEENGYRDHAEWKADFDFARSTYATFIGSRDESRGNETAQYFPETSTLVLRLPKTPKFSGKDGKEKFLAIPDINFPEKCRPHILAAQGAPGDLAGKRDRVNAPIQVRIIKRKKCGGKETAVYVQLSCRPIEVPVTTSKLRGAVAIDINADHLAITEVDRHGNWERSESLKYDLRGLSAEQSNAVLGDYVAAVVEMARLAGKPIVMEDLNFDKKKASLREKGAGYARMLSSLSYAKIIELVYGRANANGVKVIPVNPAYTSVIGAFKFYGLAITSHEKAALAIARRALGFSERTKVFHGTQTPPVWMASVGREEPETADSGQARTRHVWSLWSRNARDIRLCLISGGSKKPRCSTKFGEFYHRHPLVAKAAGVMSLAEQRGWTRKHPSEQPGSGDAARPTNCSKLSDQVCTGS